MATVKKKAKVVKKVKVVKEELTWKKHPDGGHYASYKLGIIMRYKGKYSYKTSYQYCYNAKNLAEAKSKIDQYTFKKTGK